MRKASWKSGTYFRRWPLPILSELEQEKHAKVLESGEEQKMAEIGYYKGGNVPIHSS